MFSMRWAGGNEPSHALATTCPRYRAYDKVDIIQQRTMCYCSIIILFSMPLSYSLKTCVCIIIYIILYIFYYDIVFVGTPPPPVSRRSRPLYNKDHPRHHPSSAPGSRRPPFPPAPPAAPPLPPARHTRVTCTAELCPPPATRVTMTLSCTAVLCPPP